MKKNIAFKFAAPVSLILLIAGASITSGGPAPKESIYVVTGDNVNLRETSSKGGRVLIQLKTGDRVTYISKSPGPEKIENLNAHWFKVRTGKGTVGWIYGAYLREYADGSGKGIGGVSPDIREGLAGSENKGIDFHTYNAKTIPAGIVLKAGAVRFNSREDISSAPRGKRYSCSEYLFSRDESSFLKSYGFFTKRLNPGSLNYIEVDDMVDLYGQYSGVRTTEEILELTDFDEAPVYNQAPLFITADYLLHVYHLFFMHMTEDLEQKKFYPIIKELTASMLMDSLEIYKRSSGRFMEASKKVAAFFAVPALLMGIDVPDDAVKNAASKDAEAIINRSGMGISAVSGVEEDFSQYVPRGHYTKTDELKAYFKVMMWYGRIFFPVKDPVHGMIITMLLSSEKNLPLWEAVYNPTSYMVGKSDDLDYYAYLMSMRTVFGDRFMLTDYPKDDDLKNFQNDIMARKMPRIISNKTGGADPESAKAAQQGFRFMGQRFIPDSYAFSELTSPRIGTDSAPRNMPTALDIMALLGSPDAENMAIFRYGKVPGYSAGLERLKGEFRGFLGDQSMETIYRDWLSSIGGLFAVPDSGLPRFVHTPQWRYRLLLAGHGSWAELRHDTILYAKQSYAEKGAGGEPQTVYYAGIPEIPKGYVEPNIEFMERLSAMVRNTGTLLQKAGVLTDTYREKLENFTTMVERLVQIVRAQVAGNSLSDDDFLFIANLSLTMKKVAATGDPRTFETDPETKKMALIADVHTDSLAQKVLEVGVGIPRQVFIHVNDASGGRMCIGYVYSYYEFGHPMTDRLTDEVWRKSVYDTKKQNELMKREPQWMRKIPAVR